MKLFAAIMFSLVTTVSFAQAPAKDFPATIKCHAKLVGTSPSFTITDLNTKKPDSTISDASLLDYKLDYSTLQVSFSNECDNIYNLVFFYDDLRNLKDKKVKSILGIMNYGNADMNEGRETEVESLTVSVTCTL
jgi:hypothetical protein